MKAGKCKPVSVWVLLIALQLGILPTLAGQGLRNQRVDGYRGIWFELGQKYDYGDKYSGGLGTYTAKHRPMAVYSPEVDKTFFVYGGTTEEGQRHLLCMAGAFDHQSKKVCRPIVVWDKQGVKDPHDNPSICIDHEGYIRVFVSGRGTLRPGVKLRSTAPFSIDSFKVESVAEFTYPQIWNTGTGLFHFFTRYSGRRELYFESSADGENWSEVRKLAGIKSPDDSLSGHYQLSDFDEQNNLVGTFLNRHLNGHPDTRTGLYYLQSKDLGKTWTCADGTQVKIPLSEPSSPARVLDFEARGLNVYMKDMDYDDEGNPVCLVVTSKGHEPGPDNAPYTWRLILWEEGKWKQIPVCTSDHNYDMGSLYLTDSLWYIAAPVADPPQPWGAGGEVVLFSSEDKGSHWEEYRRVTHASKLNHSYIRRPEKFRPPFCLFWASGHPHRESISELYFGDLEGRCWKLPYVMEKMEAFPIPASGAPRPEQQ